MERARTIAELTEKITYCPYCRTFDPPIRVVEAYWKDDGNVYLLSCATCHRPILCGRIEDDPHRPVSPA